MFVVGYGRVRIFVSAGDPQASPMHLFGNLTRRSMKIVERKQKAAGLFTVRDSTHRRREV